IRSATVSSIPEKRTRIRRARSWRFPESSVPVMRILTVCCSSEFSGATSAVKSMPSILTSFVSEGSSTLHARTGRNEWKRDALETAMAPIASANAGICRSESVSSTRFPPFGLRSTVRSSRSERIRAFATIPAALGRPGGPAFPFSPFGCSIHRYTLIALFENHFSVLPVYLPGKWLGPVPGFIAESGFHASGFHLLVQFDRGAPRHQLRPVVGDEDVHIGRQAPCFLRLFQRRLVNLISLCACRRGKDGDKEDHGSEDQRRNRRQPFFSHVNLLRSSHRKIRLPPPARRVIQPFRPHDKGRV